MTTELAELQELYIPAIDREVAAWLATPPQVGHFYDLMRYQLGYVGESFQPVSVHGGKRFRPILCLLAATAVGGDWREVLPAAAGIELLHNFSLIHDDIEDRDPSRRHRPTVWKVWGEAQAINAGDGMFALAGRAMLSAAADPEVALDLGREYQEVSLDLTAGQYLDMSFETRTDVTPAEYLEMIGRKTASLIGFSVWAGACVGGAGDSTRDALRQFGILFGKAFQIHDDIMGIWGDPQVTGKERAKDLLNRKKTLPILLALDRGNKHEREALRAFLCHQSNDLDGVFTVLKDTGAEGAARASAREHLSQALVALEQSGVEKKGRDDLASLARRLAG